MTSVEPRALSGPGSARAVRIGGQDVPPGDARVLRLPLPGRTHLDDAIPVWIAVGQRPGPRVTIAAAARGFEVCAARVAAQLPALIDPARIAGSVAVVPVLRPGGRFAARGQPTPDELAWRYPGDPGGNRNAREAFAVFSELVAGASALLLLGAVDPGRAAALVVTGNFDDPRVRRLSGRAFAAAALDRRPAPGSLAAAAAEAGTVVLELVAAPEGDDAALLRSATGLLTALGVVPATASPVEPARTPPVITKVTALRAVRGGLLADLVAVGQAVPRGAVLARIVPPLGERVVEVRAPHDALVLEAQGRTGVRARAPLFVLGRVAAPVLARLRKRTAAVAVNGAASSAVGAPPGRAAGTDASGAAGAPRSLRLGWVERVSLPALGISRLRAKIDTGARTSALHVARMKIVGTTAGPHRRPILELTLPRGSRSGMESESPALRVQVRDYAQVKDTSGRTERRPVIETTLRLGPLERRIRVTLTNRGDMRFPMLIGRTALGPGVVVDPAGRLLLGRTVRRATQSRKDVRGES